ncbi:MAG: FtsQ-type POTRA domain-containing protein [Alphaproteobacteria bacterium]|nr:FtsQ-type POTRA domain-containing protein [Alphaproteobacteria bacterium]
MSEVRPRRNRRGAGARREHRAWLRSPWARCGAAGGVALAVLGAVWAVLQAPGPSAWLQAQHDRLVATAIAATVDAGFAVRGVYVRGRTETVPQDVIAALGVTVGDPMLFIDLDDRRARLEALPWVEHAAIERLLPDILVVRLVERRPLALWQNDGVVAVIDRGGTVIAGVDPRRFAHLPLVVGPDAPAHAAELIAVLGVEPLLAARVTAAQWIAGRRWDLRFDNGVAAALPAQGLDAAWRRLAALERDHRLLARELVRIDLRFADRVVLRLTDEGLAAMDEARERAKGEST